MKITLTNINQALPRLREMLNDYPHSWIDISPRGLRTLEFTQPVMTVYEKPEQRVLFSPARDCNPFFHFFESLWILGGREDVAYLAQFNSRISNFSDDGKKFHAPYGHRLRFHWEHDQLMTAIDMLARDNTTRQVALSIWDPDADLGAKTKDVPCNDFIMLKIRRGALNMTVCCRSNDAVWGAYGANVVQFSVLQEFIARAVGVEVGVYRQFSDSFHVYTDNEAWNRYEKSGEGDVDPYALANGDRAVSSFPLMEKGVRHENWLSQLSFFLRDGSSFAYEKATGLRVDDFFPYVAEPLWEAWDAWKRGPVDIAIAGDEQAVRAQRGRAALGHLEYCRATDWREACKQWIQRRLGKSGE